MVSFIVIEAHCNIIWNTYVQKILQNGIMTVIKFVQSIALNKV